MTAITEPEPIVARPRFSTAAVVPLAIDLLCIVAFVAMGKENHGVHRGVGWFFNVWWPLATGLVIGGLMTRLYTARDRWPLRLVGTVAIAVIIGGPLRMITGRGMYSVFTIVAFGMLILLTFAWRLLRVAYHQVRAQPSSP